MSRCGFISEVQFRSDLHYPLLTGAAVFAEVAPQRLGRARRAEVVGDGQRAEGRVGQYTRSGRSGGSGQVGAGVPSSARRELEILKLIANGESNKEIAGRLAISEGPFGYMPAIYSRSWNAATALRP